MASIEDMALTFLPGIGVKGRVHLLECFGDAAAVFRASEEELVERAQLRPEAAHSLRKAGSSLQKAEKELAYCRRHGITPVASTDPDYPPLLREMPDYPSLLYVVGEVGALVRRTLAVVGTREATPYGQVTCSRLVESLAERVDDLCIVSGMAYGIDIAAHRAALAAGVPTVGVLANVLPAVAPAPHAAVGREVLQRGGALVSEINSQTPQNGSAFLARNRIIAGLCAGTLVIESPAVGGSLHTAACADGYHRAVMAVPGRVGDKSSFGTNNLIASHTAQLVQTADDIIREMMWDVDAEALRPAAAASLQPLTGEEERLLACFPDADPIAVEELALRSGLDLGALAALTIGLELSGFVRQLPGNRYLKIR